jgi:hypothetical protein
MIPGATPIGHPAAAAGQAQGGGSAEKAATKKGFWREASIPKKATLVLLPIALVAVAISVLMEPQRAAPPKPAPAASASATADAAAPNPAENTLNTPVNAPALPSADPSEAPSPSASAAAVSPPGTARALTPLPRGKKTQQRAAADAVAAGNFDEAMRLYEDLAKATPDDQAYAEAARIMRAKTGKK